MINDEWTIIFFLMILLVGMAAVSIHYRKNYEDLRTWIKLMEEFGHIK